MTDMIGHATKRIGHRRVDQVMAIIISGAKASGSPSRWARSTRKSRAEAGQMAALQRIDRPASGWRIGFLDPGHQQPHSHDGRDHRDPEDFLEFVDPPQH